MLHGMGPGTQAKFISWEFKIPFNTKLDNVLSAYVLEPFGRGNNYYQGFAENDIFEAIADMKQFFKVDEDRTYLNGQSMGGGGAWNIATGTPDFWAAVSINCPAFYAKQDPYRAENLTGVPIRFWYGGKDKAYYGESVRVAHKKLQELGYESEIHTTPEAGHKMPVSEREKIDKWLLKHKRVIPKKFTYVEYPPLYGERVKNALFRSGRNGIYMIPNYDEERKLRSFTCEINCNTIEIKTKNCKELQIETGEDGLNLKGEYTIIINEKERNNIVLKSTPHPCVRRTRARGSNAKSKIRNLELEEVKMTPLWQLQKYPVRIFYDSPAHRAGNNKNCPEGTD